MLLLIILEFSRGILETYFSSDFEQKFGIWFPPPPSPPFPSLFLMLSLTGWFVTLPLLPTSFPFFYSDYIRDVFIILEGHAENKALHFCCGLGVSKTVVNTSQSFALFVQWLRVHLVLAERVQQGISGSDYHTVGFPRIICWYEIKSSFKEVLYCGRGFRYWFGVLKEVKYSPHWCV